MSPGAPDLKIVDDRMAIIAACLRDLRSLPTTSLADFSADWRNAAAADAYLRRAIEALFDTARHLLSRGFGLAALEYRQVAQLVAKHGLVTDPQLCERLTLIAGFRNRLTHFYDEVTPAELFGVTTRDLGDIERLAEELRQAAGRIARANPSQPS
jgi:uncharacterized protein YutE (UPF0331/DUF86 family)